MQTSPPPQLEEIAQESPDAFSAAPADMLDSGFGDLEAQTTERAGLDEKAPAGLTRRAGFPDSLRPFTGAVPRSMSGELTNQTHSGLCGTASV